MNDTRSDDAASPFTPISYICRLVAVMMEVAKGEPTEKHHEINSVSGFWDCCWGISPKNQDPPCALN